MKVLLSLLLTVPLLSESSQLAVKKSNIPYIAKSEDSSQNERCKLDLYLPAGQEDFATLIWLHGGGLENGSKNDPANVAIAQRLTKQAIAVAMVNYRLSPKAKYPAYVEDTAAAVAWVLENISEQGGNPKKVFLGDHSAEGYLTLMVGMNPRWLAAHDLERHQLAGLLPVSAQTMTHYTVREERFGSDNPFVITGRNHSSIAHQMAHPNDPAARKILNFIARMGERQN